MDELPGRYFGVLLAVRLGQQQLIAIEQEVDDTFAHELREKLRALVPVDRIADALDDRLAAQPTVDHVAELALERVGEFVLVGRRRRRRAPKLQSGELALEKDSDGVVERCQLRRRRDIRGDNVELLVKSLGLCIDAEYAEDALDLLFPELTERHGELRRTRQCRRWTEASNEHEKERRQVDEAERVELAEAFVVQACVQATLERAPHSVNVACRVCRTSARVERVLPQIQIEVLEKAVVDVAHHHRIRIVASFRADTISALQKANRRSLVRVVIDARRLDHQHANRIGKLILPKLVWFTL